MKKLVAVLISLLVMPQLVFATAISFNKTGTYAEDLDFYGWTASSNFGQIGGPWANESRGSAFQFTLTGKTRIHEIIADVALADDIARRSLTYNYVIFTSTTTNMYEEIIPGGGGFTSDTVTLAADADREKFYKDLSTSIGVTLDEGTYWLGYQGGQGEALGFISDVRYTSAPEPSSVFLFVTGAGGLIFLRQRRRGRHSAGE